MGSRDIPKARLEEKRVGEWESQAALRYLPAYILVKISWTKASKLAGLNDCVIPIEPSFSRPAYHYLMYWLTLLLHRGVHLLSLTFMSRYQEVQKGIQFACFMILTTTYSRNTMTQHGSMYCGEFQAMESWIQSSKYTYAINAPK